jgi:hypothetical protein
MTSLNPDALDCVKLVGGSLVYEVCKRVVKTYVDLEAEVLRLKSTIADFECVC